MSFAISSLIPQDSLKFKDLTVDPKTLEGKVVAFYFSAHWCPPCRAFTPLLAEVYNTAKQMGLNFEVVFVSSDSDEDGFNEYYGSQPWMSIKYDNEDERSNLGQVFGVQGIPSLQIVKNGKLLTKDGRGAIMSNKIAAIQKWCSA
jgi:nucleoredoxin